MATRRTLSYDETSFPAQAPAYPAMATACDSEVGGSVRTTACIRDGTADARVLLSSSSGSDLAIALASLIGFQAGRGRIGERRCFDALKESRNGYLDSAEVTLRNDRKLVVSALCSQERFSFLRGRLAEAAQGVVVLIDNRRLDPLGDLIVELASFDRLLRAGRVVIGILHSCSHPVPSVELHHALGLAQASGIDVPLFKLDASDAREVFGLLDTLLARIDSTYEAGVSAHAA